MPRRVTLILDDSVYRDVEEIRREMGFYNMSEAFRYVIKLGLEVAKERARPTPPKRR